MKYQLNQTQRPSRTARVLLGLTAFAVGSAIGLSAGAAVIFHQIDGMAVAQAGASQTSEGSANSLTVTNRPSLPHQAETSYQLQPAISANKLQPTINTDQLQ